MLAAVQAKDEGRWIWRLWFECLAQAGRDEELRELAATFWRGNRERTAKLIEIALPHHTDRAKPIATALIALDIASRIEATPGPASLGRRRPSAGPIPASPLGRIRAPT